MKTNNFPVMRMTINEYRNMMKANPNVWFVTPVDNFCLDFEFEKWNGRTFKTWCEDIDEPISTDLEDYFSEQEMNSIVWQVIRVNGTPHLMTQAEREAITNCFTREK